MKRDFTVTDNVTDNLLKRVVQTFISVTDIDRAVRFYRDTLGMELLFQIKRPPFRPLRWDSETGDSPYAFFRCGDITIFLGIPESEEFRTKSAHYLVDDIDAAVAQLQGKGVEFPEKPYVAHDDGKNQLLLVHFRDPDGNYLGMFEERGGSFGAISADDV